MTKYIVIAVVIGMLSLGLYLQYQNIARLNQEVAAQKIEIENQKNAIVKLHEQRAREQLVLATLQKKEREADTKLKKALNTMDSYRDRIERTMRTNAALAERVSRKARNRFFNDVYKATGGKNAD